MASRPVASANGASKAFLVDAHVHIHLCFDLVAFLAAAEENFGRGAIELGMRPETVGCLLLVESDGADVFSRLRSLAGTEIGGGWSVQLTQESHSLLVQRSGIRRIVVVAGQQLVTSDGLEVLALLTETRISGTMPLTDTLYHVRACGGIPVLPWGFGKWWLRRGSLIQAALDNRSESLFMGDNGGRACIGQFPYLLRRAVTLGVPVLPGTDPLPFPNHESRAGSYGFVMEGDLDYDMPARVIRNQLNTLRSQPRAYGVLRSPGEFVVDQIRMQLRKRRRRLD